MTHPTTMADALAYIAITGTPKYLHFDTRVAINMYYGLSADITVGRPWVVNEKGMELARTSRLWKAHERIVALGYELSTTRRLRPSFISYYHPEKVQSKFGEYTRCAFTGNSHYDVYVDQPSEDGIWRTALLKAEPKPKSPTARTTPAEVNRALTKAGLKVEMVRGNGYYWFQDESTSIQSIYQNNLIGFTTREVVEYVKGELARIAK